MISWIFFLSVCVVTVVRVYLASEETTPCQNGSTNRCQLVNETVVLHTINNKNKKICMKQLGCFAVKEDFQNRLLRPINVLPDDRATINTYHLLYTKENTREPEHLRAHDEEGIRKSKLNPHHPTKFIVHGFRDSEFFGPWMTRMKDEFLLYDEYNIIIVDWSGGNKAPYYQAASNTRVVGAEIALLIKALESNLGKIVAVPDHRWRQVQHIKRVKGIKPEDCHVIGHSLGAHVAGYAGERLNKLGRITACDPAEPYFQHMPPSVRIDPTDADYVDVIHTDSVSILLLGFGMSQLVGHADFFPNNGRNQPGCLTEKVTSFITDGLNEVSRRFFGCNHARSLDFMHHSINYRKITSVGFQCVDWNTYLAGECASCGIDGNKCAIMGVRADEYKEHRNDSVQRSFYLTTSGKIPFWLYHYQITVKLFKPITNFKDQRGTIEINLHGTENYHAATLTKSDYNLVHGAQYRYLVTTEREIGEIESITFKWFYRLGTIISLLAKPKLYLEYIQVISMNIVEKSPRNLTGRVFCVNPENPIEPKAIVNLRKDEKCLKLLLKP